MRRRGKYAAPLKFSRVLGVALMVIALLTAVTGGVAAYLSYSTGAVENIFVADEATDPSIQENFDRSTKTDVFVNVGDPGYTVYVRAAVVVTWQNAAGNVLGVAPIEGTDYSISYNETGWERNGGFWYCKSAIAQGETPVLIHSCSPMEGKTPEGYGLNVEIIAQTIQAEGTTDKGNIAAVQDAWGITPGTT